MREKENHRTDARHRAMADAWWPELRFGPINPWNCPADWRPAWATREAHKPVCLPASKSVPSRRLATVGRYSNAISQAAAHR